MAVIPDLIARIEAHCRQRGIAETTFGRLAVNDGKLLRRLRDGRSITLDTVDRIERALAPPETEAAA